MAEHVEQAPAVRPTPPRHTTIALPSALSDQLAGYQACQILFATVEQLLTEQAPMTLARLGKQVARIAGPLSEGAGLELAHWNAMSQAGMTALLMTGALLTPAGRTITADVTAQASMVGSLRDGYRDSAEAFLLEFPQHAARSSE